MSAWVYLLEVFLVSSQLQAVLEVVFRLVTSQQVTCPEKTSAPEEAVTAKQAGPSGRVSVEGGAG